ncbi:MAG: hypothetical protein LH660_20675 [Phormidesmis sp. CAN_BIN36]|nr:hypothetical protein [Phormidesmis sp. CAN_BIN36]
MLTRLFLLIACSIAATPLFVGGAIASSTDIGGAPVKAVPTPTTYTTVYSQTNYTDQFGIPRSIIIIPSTYTYDSFGFSSTPSMGYPQTGIVTPNIQTTTVRGLLQPSVPFHPFQSSNCNKLTLGLASGRSVSVSSGCW